MAQRILMTTTPDYPKLSRLMPAMASDEVQRNWTGDCGPALLRLSVGFTRSMAYNYARFTGRGLEGATILDFGCGYGRLLRRMYALTAARNVYGVDPWSKSIELCYEAGLTENLFVSDYLPESLPIGDIFRVHPSVRAGDSHRATNAPSRHEAGRPVADDRSARGVLAWRRAHDERRKGATRAIAPRQRLRVQAGTCGRRWTATSPRVTRR